MIRSQNWWVFLMACGLAVIVVLTRAAPVRAEPDTTPWTSPSPIATGLSGASHPVLTITSDGIRHATWESEGQIYYAAQAIDQSWGTPRRVATGISPVMVTDNLGRLHILFANQFMGNYEIYEVTPQPVAGWSLPVNVSHTSGFSAFPAAALGADGALYVAWMDNSPGYWTIYVGTRKGSYWSNEPVPNARGQAPALAAAPDGTLYLAWQDRVPTANDPGRYDVFVSERYGSSWSLPVNVSDRPSVDSIGADLTTTPDSLVQMTWVDGNQEVRYCLGQGSYWPYPMTVARAATVARGPHIQAEGGWRLHIAWDEGDMVRAASAPPGTVNWPKPVVIAAPIGDLRDASLSLRARKGISLSWVQTSQPGDVGIYESWRASEFTPSAWLPIILR